MQHQPDLLIFDPSPDRLIQSSYTPSVISTLTSHLPLSPPPLPHPLLHAHERGACLSLWAGVSSRRETRGAAPGWGLILTKLCLYQFLCDCWRKRRSLESRLLVPTLSSCSFHWHRCQKLPSYLKCTINLSISGSCCVQAM